MLGRLDLTRNTSARQPLNHPGTSSQGTIQIKMTEPCRTLEQSQRQQSQVQLKFTLLEDSDLFPSILN